MTKVNQLLEKALSTSSEDEAISCLRLARKRHTGETVSVSPSTASSKFNDGVDWKKETYKYYNIAVERDNLLTESRKRAEYFMKEMTKAQIERNKYDFLYQETNNSKKLWKSAFFGSLVLSGFFAAMAFVAMGLK